MPLKRIDDQGMGVIYVLLAISLMVAVIFFVAFVISVRRGQYDDTYTPSVRMLFEDELLPGEKPGEGGLGKGGRPKK